MVQYAFISTVMFQLSKVLTTLLTTYYLLISSCCVPRGRAESVIGGNISQTQQEDPRTGTRLVLRTYYLLLTTYLADATSRIPEQAHA